MEKKMSVRYLTELALLMAITLVMAYTPLGYLRVGPLNASFLTVPIAVGAITLGPAAGAFLGLVFGLTSFGNALMGGSAMGMALMEVSAAGYFVQAVIGRVLMGFFCGVVFLLAKKAIGEKTPAFAIGAVSAPLLNTFFYMGLLVLIFYNCDYVQNLVSSKGVGNPIAFILAVVGVQGLIEAIVCGIVGCAITRALSAVLGRNHAKASAQTAKADTAKD